MHSSELPKEHPLDVLGEKHNIRHQLIPSGQCELNGKVERSHRIDEEGFYRLSSYESLKEIQADPCPSGQVTFQK